jgi:hypothetical protein
VPNPRICRQRSRASGKTPSLGAATAGGEQRFAASNAPNNRSKFPEFAAVHESGVGTNRTTGDVCCPVAIGGKADVVVFLRLCSLSSCHFRQGCMSFVR